ncbi:MAG: hypothetical protein QGI49_03660, partial [SAR202 cluster bacterium]|nr:hypothetical protein [SAR202 cluster bacterium]
VVGFTTRTRADTGRPSAVLGVVNRCSWPVVRRAPAPGQPTLGRLTAAVAAGFLRRLQQLVERPAAIFK